MAPDDRVLPCTRAVATPGAAGRLQVCCRVFRAIFSGDWLWEHLCADLLAEEELRAKPAEQGWRSFYASWAPTPEGWFRAYAKMARQLLEEEALGMALRFEAEEGEDLPPEWRDAGSLKVKDICVTDFGVTGHAGFDEGTERSDWPVDWDTGPWIISGASVVAQLGAEEFTILEANCSGCEEFVPLAPSDFFEWVQRHLGVKCCGLHISRSFLGFGEGDEDGVVEELDIKVMIPTHRFLEGILGQDVMRQRAAELLGIGRPSSSSSSGLMLFAELRQQAPWEGWQVFESEEDQPLVARIRTAVPAPAWRNLRRDFFFRRGYRQALREAGDGAQPLPSFDFAFDFEEVRECSSDRFLLSFWCLDASGRTSFASHLVPLSTNPHCPTDCKAQCVVHVPAVITPDCDWRFFLAKLAARSGPHQLPHHDGASPGVRQLHLIMPPVRLPESFDHSECLRAVLGDYIRRQARHEPTPGNGSAPQEVSGDFAESDSESDMEEERSWWEHKSLKDQESLAIKLSHAQRRAVLSGNQPVPMPTGSPWRGMAPLRRCRTCRCILTQLLADGGLHREQCVRCGP